MHSEWNEGVTDGVDFRNLETSGKGKWKSDEILWAHPIAFSMQP